MGLVTLVPLDSVQGQFRFALCCDQRDCDCRERGQSFLLAASLTVVVRKRTVEAQVQPLVLHALNAWSIYATVQLLRL